MIELTESEGERLERLRADLTQQTAVRLTTEFQVS